MTYTEQINSIRNKYNCSGDAIFYTALQIVIEVGQRNILDPDWYESEMKNIDTRHDAAEKENKVLLMTRDFEQAIIECTKYLAQIDPMSLIKYIQRETWLGNDGINHERAFELLQNCLNYCEYETYEAESALAMARDIGFEDDEIEELGYGYMLDCEKEEDNDEN